jgi:hypothetical protein
MQLTAKLSQVLPLQTGTGKNGEWQKQDVILETEGQYPKKICISIWGDKINQNQLVVGNQLKIDFDIESREFNGKWYTDVKAWKVEVVEIGIKSDLIDKKTEDFNDINGMGMDDEEILPF